MTRLFAIPPLAALTLLASGCVMLEATPVKPVPLRGAKAEALRKALIGRWVLVDERKVGGERKRTSSSLTTWLTFHADGSMRYEAKGFLVSVDKVSRWTLEGANIRTTSPLDVIRADAWDGRELAIFWYGLSYQGYLQRA